MARDRKTHRKGQGLVMTDVSRSHVVLPQSRTGACLAFVIVWLCDFEQVT